MMNMERPQAAADPQPRPNDLGCESACRPPIGCQKPHPPSPFIIITQSESWYSFYHPTEGRRLSRHRHCSKGVQPVPKAVYRSDVYDKHAHGATVGFEPRSSHTAVTAVRHVTARPLRPAVFHSHFNFPWSYINDSLSNLIPTGSSHYLTLIFHSHWTYFCLGRSWNEKKTIYC